MPSAPSFLAAIVRACVCLCTTMKTYMQGTNTSSKPSTISNWVIKDVS